MLWLLFAGQLLVAGEWWADMEARLGHAVAATVLDGDTLLVPDQATFYFGLGTPNALGLHLDAGCSTRLILIPTLLVGALFAGFRRVGAVRLLLATTGTVALLLTANVGRLLIIGLGTMGWGRETGFGWAHSFSGPIFMMVMLVAALLLNLRILLGVRLAFPLRGTRDGKTSPKTGKGNLRRV
ncbi:archaeosortase/exosortase family protein [Streptomyces sp. NBC_01304]|uniref:archaeosortase/exosortase family protein n=1 Tax=Streptomyces sp. NBC_01304 TaxID=2903818 RepID=UPI002E1575C7|nr:archaeosortase/exosortase family protein [Streptomyces sp. NBC_01304]